MLKQTISNIENFLCFFNPFTKYDLCRYWQRLEEKGYDPVSEYNKRLEMFDMQYSPTPETLFLIMLQISRFLKEFAEFETKHTPAFRHPFIRNKITQRRNDEADKEDLESIKAAREFRLKHRVKIRNFLNPGQKPKKTRQSLQQELEWPFDSEDEIELPDQELIEEEPDESKIDYLNDIGIDREMRNMKMTDAPTSRLGLKEHEGVNIEVQSGRVAVCQLGCLFRLLQDSAQ